MHVDLLETIGSLLGRGLNERRPNRPLKDDRPRRLPSPDAGVNRSEISSPPTVDVAALVQYLKRSEVL
jgi:hypothetical protein